MPETNTANYGAAIMKCMQMIQPGHPYLSEDSSTRMTKEQRSQNECIDLAVANEEIALIIKAKKQKKREWKFEKESLKKLLLLTKKLQKKLFSSLRILKDGLRKQIIRYNKI